MDIGTVKVKNTTIHNKTIEARFSETIGTRGKPGIITKFLY